MADSTAASFAGRGGGAGAASPLEGLMRRRGVDEAWDALDDMLHSGVQTNRFTVSRMLMKTLTEARKVWEPAKIQRSVALVKRFMDLQPDEADEVLFNALLDTHCRMKDSAGLEATLQRMQDLHVVPSHVTLGILVKAYGQACDIKSVLRLWDEMVEQRQQANAVTYGCMINACVRCGQTVKALEIFDEMKVLGKHCNTILYTTLIKGYGNEKDLSSALALFREMEEEGVPYNTIAFNSIIDVCVKCNDLQAAEDIFQEMFAQGNMQPDLITYSTLLKGYCHVGNLDKALQVAETIKACGLKCDELVYNTLMDGCVKANDLSAGVGLFAEMIQSGMRPSPITHSIFMRLYQRNGYKGNASEAVAQLYQHHGLERPTGLEKAPRSYGTKGSRSQNNQRGSFGSLAQGSWGGQQQQQQRQQQSAGYPTQRAPELPRGAGGAPPGCWNSNPKPPSSLLNGLGTTAPCAAPQRSMLGGSCGWQGSQMEASSIPGIMGRMSTYSGMPLGHMPAMCAHPQQAHQQTIASLEGTGIMQTSVPWLPTTCHPSLVMQEFPGAPRCWDATETQFPSLLVQRHREECFGDFGLDLRKPAMMLPEY